MLQWLDPTEWVACGSFATLPLPDHHITDKRGYIQRPKYYLNISSVCNTILLLNVTCEPGMLEEYCLGWTRATP